MADDVAGLPPAPPAPPEPPRPGHLARLRADAGRRGAALGLVAVLFTAYGTGLVAGYRPTFAVALHLPVTSFGWTFIAAGAFVLTGVERRSDRWQFAVAVLVMMLWALLLATHWTQPYGWAAAVSWLGPCALTVLIAGWPEDRR
jgi:hypothetical protein